MNEPSWSASVPGYIVVDVDVLVPFGSITWEAVCVGCDSAIPWSLGEAWDLSEGMESMEIREGVLERFGETMCSSPLQETTLRVAMI